MKKTQKIVVLATGGTIAGWAGDVTSPQNYQAGQVGVDDLLIDLALDDFELVSEQVAQIDSKDMSFEVWQQLLQRIVHWQSQDDVRGIVITHGTDTVEETAFMLARVLPTQMPIALTCAMLPANAPNADGPANLKSALQWVTHADAAGVVLVCAGQVHRGLAVQKAHSQDRNPFISSTSVTLNPALRAPSVAQVLACTVWPRVALIHNAAGVDGRLVRTLMAHDAPDGWVVAGTGNGTVQHDLEAALLEAQACGVFVLRASRCAGGGVQTRASDVLPHAGSLTAVQARVALILHLLSLQQA